MSSLIIQADQFASNFEAQLDFNDEARNLRFFGANFGTKFWSSLVTFPQPVGGLVSHDVLVETFEEGESVARFLERKGAREAGEWSKDAKGEWVMAKTEQDLTEGNANDLLLRANIASCGIQAYLKMLIWDNKIHADLHPGNVLIRLEEVSFLQRAQRWFILGDSSARVPHIVFLDAGLAAHFNPHIHSNVNGFFDAIVRYDGVAIGTTVLGLVSGERKCEQRSGDVCVCVCVCREREREKEREKEKECWPRYDGSPPTYTTTHNNTHSPPLLSPLLGPVPTIRHRPRRVHR